MIYKYMVWYSRRNICFYIPIRKGSIYENKYIIGSKVPCGIWMNDLIFCCVRVVNENLFALYAKFLKGQYWFVIQLYCCVFVAKVNEQMGKLYYYSAWCEGVRALCEMQFNHCTKHECITLTSNGLLYPFVLTIFKNNFLISFLLRDL